MAVSDEMFALMRADYWDRDFSFLQLATKYGVSNGAVQKAFDLRNEPRRSQGIRRRPGWEHQLAQIRRMRAKGLNWKQIGFLVCPESKRPHGRALRMYQVFTERERSDAAKISEGLAGLRRQGLPGEGVPLAGE